MSAFNIEEEFFNFSNQSAFPHKNDYVGLYKKFKDRFDKDIHPEVKTKILEIEQSGYYNDHGVGHIAMVIERVSWILENLKVSFLRDNVDSFYISPYEVFILLMAIQLHDTGHLIGKRADHTRKGKELLSKFDKGSDLSSAERMHIGDIAKAHGGKNNPIGNLQLKSDVAHQTIRPQLLAALLRLGDELAEDRSRASNFLVNNNEIERTSEIFHRYSQSLESVKLDGCEIHYSFYIEDRQLIRNYPLMENGVERSVYLIDEIYSRTYKTFTESIYCSRFLPNGARYNVVKVEIHLMTSHDNDNFKTINYELREIDYPSVSQGDIFQICCSTLKENGNNIDGKYIDNFIKEKILNK